MRRRAAEPELVQSVDSVPWNTGLLLSPCSGLASQVQLTEPSSQPLLDGCCVLTDSFSSFRKQWLFPRLQHS